MNGHEIIRSLHEGRRVYASAIVAMSPLWPALAKSIGIDFVFVDTTAANTVAGQRLGAPGPQKLGSPIQRNSTITALLLDSNFGGPAPPNRFRSRRRGSAPRGRLAPAA